MSADENKYTFLQIETSGNAALERPTLWEHICSPGNYRSFVFGGDRGTLWGEHFTTALAPNPSELEASQSLHSASSSS